LPISAINNPCTETSNEFSMWKPHKLITSITSNKKCLLVPKTITTSTCHQCTKFTGMDHSLKRSNST
jgi:hypothetical protein